MSKQLALKTQAKNSLEENCAKNSKKFTLNLPHQALHIKMTSLKGDSLHIFSICM